MVVEAITTHAIREKSEATTTVAGSIPLTLSMCALNPSAVRVSARWSKNAMGWDMPWT